MIRQHVLGVVASVSLLLCASLAATDSLSFHQEALTRGLDRLREVAAASSIPYDPNSYNLPYGMFLSDLDGDGLLDVYVPNHGQVPHRSGLWINNGSGAFSPNIFTVSLTSPSAYLNNTGWMYEPVDLNGDGRPDLHFGGWYSYGVVCYNRGVSSAGGWTGPRFECRQSIYPVSFAGTNRDSPGLSPLPFADVNRDGRLDILTYQNPSAYDNYLSLLRTLPTVWRLNNGNEDTRTWPAVTSEFDLVGAAPAGALLDLNGDGLPDKIQGIPVASSQRGPFGVGSGGTEVYFGQPDRTYALQPSGLESVTSPIAALEDVNRDGCIDVGFDDSSYKDNQYWYLQNVLSDGRCAGTWHWVGRTSPELPHFLGAWRQSMDLDNSGVSLDVVIVKSAYGNTGGYSGGVHVFQQQPDRSWVEVYNHGIDLNDAYYSALRAGDWNDDGLPDIAGQGGWSMPDTDHGIALFTNQSVNANRWVKVRLPELSGRFIGTATIELFAAGQAGIAAAKIGRSITLTTGYHWPSTWYHLGAGARTTVDVRVTFPDGQVRVVTMPTNQRVSISATPPSDNQVPTVSVTAPGAGAVLSGIVNVTANAADNVGVAGVQLLIDGVALGSEDLTDPYGFSWNTATVPNGTHTLGALARDAAGNVGTADTVSVTVANNTPPTVNAGADQTVTLPNNAILHGTVSDDGLPNGSSLTVNWSMVSGPAAVTFSAPTSRDTTATVSVAGTYVLRLSASDGAATGQDDLVLTVQQPSNGADTTPPTVTFTYPSDGAVVARKSALTMTATATDNKGVVSVSFYANGSIICIDGTAPYTCSVSVPDVARTYQLQAKANDAANNIGASAVVTMIVK